MESWELNITAPPRRRNNWYPFGHVPFNKGLKMINYMDPLKIPKVLKCLEIGRHIGNAKYLHDHNCKKIVGIKNGKLYPFASATKAAEILKAKGIKINCTMKGKCKIICKVVKCE